MDDKTAIEKSKIQTLYEACRLVFCQLELPNFKQIQYLKNLLGKIDPNDVGIDEFGKLPCHGSPSSSENHDNDMRFICGQDVSEITYIHIHQCDDFSIGVFCLPAGATLPLHDHPGMTVLTKILYGSVYVRAYDWVKECYSLTTNKTFGLAATVRDEILRAPCETSVLFPRGGGNIHSFTAMSPCAILDVLTPPYSDDHGRPSTYFSVYPVPSLQGYVVLRETDLPDELVVAGGKYLGPPIHHSDGELATHVVD